MLRKILYMIANNFFIRIEIIDKFRTSVSRCMKSLKPSTGDLFSKGLYNIAYPIFCPIPNVFSSVRLLKRGNFSACIKCTELALEFSLSTGKSDVEFPFLCRSLLCGAHVDMIWAKLSDGIEVSPCHLHISQFQR